MRSPLPLAICLIVTLLMLTSEVANAQEASGGHQLAAKRLFAAMHSEKSWNASVSQIANNQVAANPDLARFREMIDSFVGGQMGWRAIEPQITEFYTAEFSEAELNSMADFYETKVGQKMVEKMPLIMQQATNIGMQRLQKSLPQLQQRIDEARARLNPSGE